MPDYSQSKIHLISPNVGGEEGDVYVGATTKPYLVLRFAELVRTFLSKSKHCSSTILFERAQSNF